MLILVMICGALIAAFGLYFVIRGFLGLVRLRDRRRRWLRCPGQAIDVVYGNPEDPGYQSWVLQWVGPDGVVRTGKNPYGTRRPKPLNFPFPLEVRVNPDNPDEAQAAEGDFAGPKSYVPQVWLGGIFVAVGVFGALSQLL